MYQVNDLVLYGMDGVCTIESVSKQRFAGVIKEYYILKPIAGNSATIYVPTDNEKLLKKMRHILSREEIYQLIRGIPTSESIWIEDENERKKKYREILSSGDRVGMIQMIKALYLHRQEQQKKGRKLHLLDEHFFKEAERILHEEFATVLDIAPEQVLPFIAQEMEIKG